MGKSLFVTALLLIVSTAYFIALLQSIAAYEDWKEIELQRYRPELRPYVDFAPYASSSQGGQMIVLGALVSLLWLTAIMVQSKREDKVNSKQRAPILESTS